MRTTKLNTWQVLFVVLCFVSSFKVIGHESRPAYLEINEQSPGLLQINWTRPIRDGRALNIHPVFPVICRPLQSVSRYQLAGLIHERWILDCSEAPLPGQSLSIFGLNNTISDVLLRFQREDGSHYMQVIDKERPDFMFPAVREPVTNITVHYFYLGVEHIAEGVDHLLFVFALLLLINGLWNLIKTITAFTLAHSITLAAAVLGYVHVPSGPVEAVIALSIVFLACELLRADRHSISRRWPWLIAIVFGLVHGLGFAGALSEIGLPEGDIPLALLMFNLGVEFGQVMFVIFALAVLTLLRQFLREKLNRVEFIGSYAVGGVAAFWLVERVAGFY